MTERASYAAIDIGTNSVLLVIAAASPTGPRPLLERASITRLGEGVDRSHALSAPAALRTLECLRGYADDLRAYGSPALDVVGTSALRDARGAEAFLDEAQRLLGERPRVIDGNEEAELTFRGALSGLSIGGAVLVFDVGGGSTELILGDANERRIDQRLSLDIGSVRLTERHLRGDPPSESELSAVVRDAEAALTRAPRANGVVTLVGVAGTVTTVKAIELGLEPYDVALVHGATLTRSSVERVCSDLARLTLAQRRNLPGLQPKRADVIVAGSIIVREVLKRFGASELVVSDRGVRFGLLERLARQ